MGYCCFDDEPATLHNETWPKARKEHKCCECRVTINVGEIYQRIEQLYDGDWSTYKTCEKCADLRESLGDVICVYYGELKWQYKEYLDDAGKWKLSEIEPSLNGFYHPVVAKL